MLDRRARLSWAADGHRCPQAARLLDISRGGAAVEVKGVPPGLGGVRLALCGPRGAEGVEATVARVDAGGGVWRVSLRFTTPCPDSVLRRAVFGR